MIKVFVLDHSYVPGAIMFFLSILPGVRKGLHTIDVLVIRVL